MHSESSSEIDVAGRIKLRHLMQKTILRVDPNLVPSVFPLPGKWRDPGNEVGVNPRFAVCSCALRALNKFSTDNTRLIAPVGGGWDL